MMTACREVLRTLESAGDHAGLALEKFLQAHSDKGEHERDLLEKIARITVSSNAYKTAFNRWTNTVSDASVLTATLRTPLAIGLGNASPLENGLTIHRTYGTPYLPGSALKGLARRAATDFKLETNAIRVLFGEAPEGKRFSANERPGSAAHLVFWDAWLEPESQQTPFQLDVITVHHQAYYGSRGAKGYPTDFDDPNPVAFLSVQPGARFRVAVSSQSENAEPWIRVALELLKHGLENLGLGGKTNAGYGYFAVHDPLEAERYTARSAELLELCQPEIAKITNPGSLNKASDIVRRLRNEAPAARQRTLEALKARIEDLNLWKLSDARCQAVEELLRKP